MASSTPPGPRGNWRSTPAPAAPDASPSASLPAWRQMSPAPVLPPRVRVARLAGVLGLVFGTATLLAWLLLWLAPPGPACLILAGAGYEDNLAVDPNPQGREALTRFARLAGTSSPLSWLFQRSGRLRVAHSPLEVLRGTDWWRGLDDVREQTIVVFLALHGGADAQGAYLLPQDASAAPADRLRLEAVLDRLAELPADRHKLLILDATAQGPSWSLGLLHNDFARALDALEPRIAAIPNLLVLSSSGINQRSWPAADLRTTLFARCLLQGLAGDADADRNGRLQGWEIYQYLAREVQTDARRLHGAEQLPVLLPRAEAETRARALSLTFQLDSTALDGDPLGDPLGDISAAWAHYDSFRPRAASARACVPGDWELWQAWLVRYQTLRLAGSPAAPRIADLAREAGLRVRQGLDLQLASGALSLQMPAVQGYTQLTLPDSYPPMEQLWQANVADRRTVWDQLRANDSDGLLRRNVLLALVRRAAENPARHLERAAELARLLDDPIRVVRPAEVHFLVLLQRDLAVRPLPDGLNQAVQQGLRVRLLAEEAALAVPPAGYAYAERIRPWIVEPLARADALRQKAEDLLFASDPTRWTSARELLDQAATLYQQARDTGVGLREALAACDRGAAQLPAFARFVAAQTDDPNDTLLNRTLTLFAQLDHLEQATLDVLARHDAAGVAAIRQEAQTAQTGLDFLQTHLDAFARTCETTQAAPLRDGGIALRVPWLEGAQRDRLLLKLARLANQARSESEARVEVTPEQLNDAERRCAVREGRLALAALGRTWFDANRGAGLAFTDVEPFVRRPDLEGLWSKVLRWAGDEVGARFRAYPPQAEQLVAQARKAQQVAGPLRRADRLQRRYDAGQWQAAPVQAPVLARRADVEDLLVWQARRSFSDHWYNDDPAGAPYYRIAGIDFLTDARRLDPFARPDAPGAADVARQLNAPDGLTITPGPAPHMIAGDRSPVSAVLAARDPGAVRGYPLLWAVPGDSLAFAQPDGAQRTAVSLGDDPTTDRVRVVLASPLLDRAEQDPPLEAVARTSEITWQGYYRGQKPRAVAPVYLHPAAEYTRDDAPPPNRAGVAVQAADSLFARFGEARGGLVIVVDCSGSVGPPPAAPGAPALPANERPADEARARFRQTVETLRRSLATVPRGTRLSLWIFGQAIPPRNTVTRAEDTIQRLREPSTWNATAEEIDSLVGLVSAQEPWNESPIARAVLRAREDLLKVDGFRTLLLLSDGDDNRFATDREANPDREAIPDVLRRRLADTGITLHVVGFAGKDGQPEASLVNNFGFTTTRIPPGVVATVSKPDAVLAALRQTMPAGLRYELTEASLGDERGERIEVSREGENDRWNLTTGGRDGYRLRVPLLNFDRRMTLRPGDFALLRLDDGPFGWRRLTWSRQDAFSLRPAVQTGGWRAAVLQEQTLGERAMQMLLTLEQESPRSADPGQVYPGAVWLELQPTASKERPAVRWGQLFGFPAPAYGIDAPGWPLGNDGPPPPVLRAWWATPSAQSSRLLRRPTDFTVLEELLGPQTIGDEHFTLDRATVEEHWVQVQPGRREKRWCAVIGATYSIGQPVWVQPEGATPPAGQEHRHFLAAGRYVGLFWFTDATSEQAVRTKIDTDWTGLRLVSVAALKRQAQALQHQAAFTQLDSPAPLPPRPRPVYVAP
ncbi:MAG: vWA domain-containing protein [Gemmataceae bacterium]